MEKDFTIHLASDHRGLEAKRAIMDLLASNGYDVKDHGPFVYRPEDDYIDYAVKVCTQLQRHPKDKAMLICGSGIGMYIAANKFRGIRASLCTSPAEAVEDKIEHESNVLVLDEKILNADYGNTILSWLWTPQEQGGRHERRTKKLALIESEMIRKLPKPTVVPATLSPDIEDYKNQAITFSKFSKRIHIDVMDGRFVPSISPDAVTILEHLKNVPVFQAVHLMVEDPVRHFEALRAYKRLYLVYVHAETVRAEDLDGEYPFEISVVIDPDTDIEAHIGALMRTNIVQIMTVKPGAQGADFVPQNLDLIPRLRKAGFMGEIHIDGHISSDTIQLMMDYAPDVLNVGSYIAHAENPKAAYHTLKKRTKTYHGR